MNPRGVNLEYPQSASISHGKRKRSEDASPFFALRPAMSSTRYPSGSVAETNRVKGVDTEDGLNSSWLRRLPEPQIFKVQQKKTNAKRRRDKRDWTFSEHCEGWEEEKVSVDEVSWLPALVRSYWLNDSDNDWAIRLDGEAGDKFRWLTACEDGHYTHE